MTKENFINACYTFLGLPYIWGGDDTIKGYDCSGLVQDLLAMIGLDPSGDQTAQALHDYFKNKSTDKKGCGSLVFYGSSVSHVTHVALMIDESTIIEAGGGGSKTTSSEVASQQNAFIRLRPVNRRKDLVAIMSPNGLPWG